MRAASSASACRTWPCRGFGVPPKTIWEKGRKALAGRASLVRWTDQGSDRIFLAGVGDQALSSAGFAMLGMPSGCWSPAQHPARGSRRPAGTLDVPPLTSWSAARWRPRPTTDASYQIPKRDGIGPVPTSDSRAAQRGRDRFVTPDRQQGSQGPGCSRLSNGLSAPCGAGRSRVEPC
jgi:hypothetical protein